MARCHSKGLKNFSGRVGNVIFYRVRGVLYARAYPTEVKDCRSELQVYYRERMKWVVTFYEVIRQTLLVRVWQAMGRNKNRSAYNLFVQANIRAFNGMALFYNLVHFSSGNLFLPNGLQAGRDGDKVRLTWKNEGVLSDERLEDELWCVIMMEDKNFRVIEPERTGSVRRDENAEVELAEEQGEKVYLYCFFGSVGRTDFTENMYFEL